MLTDLTAIFPNLKNFRRTSDPTPDYNCFAWALGDATKWWEPDPFGLLYWPSTVRRTYSLTNYLKVCEGSGYHRCADGSLEPGYEKIVLFTQNKQFCHAARQLPDGKWTSKLGENDDISHAELGVFDGGTTNYGEPTIYLKRKITP